MTALEQFVELPDGVEHAPHTYRVALPLELLGARLFDIAFSVVCLVLAAPFLLLVALVIRLETPGPAIFKQTRVGKDGRAFTFYKLRGMYIDAQERWPQLYDYDFSPQELQNLRFHPESDPRVTGVGRLIRRSSVDELLNFWNVLKGDMSVVGPRPEIPEMIPYYGDAAEAILTVKPGITSLAKVTGRDELTFSETLELDLTYVATKSLLLDLKIVAATVATVLLQRGVLPG